jgi:hypothetical protein
MAFDLANYFLDNAIRLQRHNWGGGGTHLLAQEMTTLLWGIQRSVTQTTTTDPDGNPFVVPPINFPSLPGFPTFDFDIPGSPALDPPTVVTPTTPAVNPNNPQAPNPDPGDSPQQPDDQQTGQQQAPHRAMFPGLVKSGSGGTYQVELRMGVGSNRTVSASSISGLAIPIGAWVNVFMAAQYTQTVTQMGGQTTGDLQATSESYFIMPPAGALAITTGEISAQENNEPGSGSATLRTYDNGSWGSGESITVYNSTSSEVEQDKLIQVKQCYGLWFVDVEDCAAPSTSQS